jgi:hypothetical protein
MAAIVGSQRGRVGSLLVAIGAFLLVLATVIFVTAVPAALAGHIDATGPLQDNCVEFQVEETGTESPEDYPDVDITLDEWVEDEGDFHEFDFTISGLVEPGQWVEISVKTGNEVEEDPGPYGNGTHTFVSGDQQGISHIRLCVFEEEITTTTTTSTSTTTTTVADTTTTTVADTTTTTVADTTTTTVADTTTTTVADTTTTTVGGPEEPTTTTTGGGTTTTVLGPDDPELPNNGPGQLLAIFLGGLGLLFMGSGSLVIASERRLTIR